MIVSANLERQAKKVYLELKKLRKKGWFSRDVSDMLIEKYGQDKKIYCETINENQKQINKLYDENKTLAKKINKLR